MDFGRHRGLFFFLERLDKHYERMNEGLLKPLLQMHLEQKPHPTKPRGEICDDYRFQVTSLPSASDLRPAVLHLKLSNPIVAQNLGNLRGILEKYDNDVDTTEKYIVSKLVNAFTERELTLPADYGHNILHILSQVWRKEYVRRLDERLGFMSPVTEKLLEELDTWKRTDEGERLCLGALTVWIEKKDGEKAKVIAAMKAVLVDTMILEKLRLLEFSEHKLKSGIVEIVESIGRLSKTIENLAYEGRADCCYTNIPWFIRLLV